MSEREVPSETSVRVPVEFLRGLTRAAFTTAGLDEESAAIVEEVLVRTSLRGVASHGLHAVPQYRRQLLEGGAKADAPLSVEAERGGVIRVDAHAALGPLAASQATELAIARARAHGVAIVSVRNANHFGAAGHYALQGAEAGCIAMVAANTPPIMAVTGSRARTIGNSPLGFGAPRTGGVPFVLDIAMSRVAGGKVRLALQRGAQVPFGWILDPDGEPTTEPADFLERRGALVPMEDHKGYGLSLMVETLAGALSGAAMLHGVGNWLYTPETPSDTGYFLMLIDASPDSLYDGVQARIGELCERISAAPLAPGAERILIPGELEAEHEMRALEGGLELPESAWAPLRALAVEIGLDLPRTVR